MTPKKILRESSDKEIATLFKEMLRLLEDMKADHDFHYEKLYENIPEEFHPIIKAADHFTARKVAWIRKRILDYGNESVRNIQQELENFEISFIFKQKE